MADFNNTVATVLPGFGSATQRQKSVDNSQGAGTSTYTLTFAPGIRRGYFRVRTKGSAADPPVVSATGVTTTSMKITCTDGTRTYTLLNLVGGIGAANEQFDLIKDFNLDILATGFTLTLITAVGAIFVDFECVGGG